MPSDLPAAHRRYEQRPRPVAGPLSLDLGPQELLAIRGSSHQAMDIGKIEQIRLFYAPANTQRLCFKCEVRAQDGRSLVFSNISWMSMINSTLLDDEYSGFTRELVARIAKASPQVRLLAGVSNWRYRLFFLAFALIAPTMLASAGSFAFHGKWPLGLLTLGLLVWFVYFSREYLARNRPRHFTAEAIPPEVMPAEIMPAA